jgi:hypothetical protein
VARSSSRLQNGLPCSSPILAFGNSDGDQQMLEWTAAGAGARFMGLVHHPDAAREYAYDRASPDDWKAIFPK